ncbi:MAG: phosphoadenylyl-sulfate reductase [Candidatus Dormibacterales bacterium]
MNLESASAEEILAWALEGHERPALVASFQIESCVLIDMASRIRPGLTVLTLDTGRLPLETLQMFETVALRYPVQMRVLRPDPAAVLEMASTHGPDLFREAVRLRRLCCEVRKGAPLRAALREHDAWITGLRRAQSATRAAVPVAAPDRLHGGIMKVAPLARWTGAQVWEYARRRDVPVHPLYGRGFTSIGCAPCTRPTSPGEAQRAGRWWWEPDAVKECGLHWSEGPAAAPA